jgi:mono/diheme cytochrome c family protein
MKKILLSLLVLAFISCETKSYKKEDGSIDSKAMFNDNCASCHGKTGDATIGGAKDLTISTLSLEQIYNVITNGTGNGMMAYKNIIETEAERKELAKYVMGFRD